MLFLTYSVYVCMLMLVRVLNECHTIIEFSMDDIQKRYTPWRGGHYQTLSFICSNITEQF